MSWDILYVCVRRRCSVISGVDVCEMSVYANSSEEAPHNLGPQEPHVASRRFPHGRRELLNLMLS